MGISKNLKEIIYTTIVCLSIPGFIGSLAYGIREDLEASRMINSAIERFPEKERLFRSHIRYELPENERELIESKWNHLLYGIGGALASFILMGYSMVKLDELERTG